MPERKIAILVRLRQELKDQLAHLAKREHRSLNQQIEFILEHFLAKFGRESPAQGRDKNPPSRE
jgi:hypothetical protein